LNFARIAFIRKASTDWSLRTCAADIHARLGDELVDRLWFPLAEPAHIHLIVNAKFAGN